MRRPEHPQFPKKPAWSPTSTQPHFLEAVYLLCFLAFICFHQAIRTGANAFLLAEYTLCSIFIVLFSVVVFVLTAKVDGGWHWDVGALTTCSFAVGGFTSIFSGYIGMTVATYANARTTISAVKAGPQVCYQCLILCAFRCVSWCSTQPQLLSGLD